MSSGPETKLVKAMRDAGAEKYGSRLVSIKYHGSAYSQAGVSDLLCCVDGVFVACEAKAPGKAANTTVKQRAFLETVEAAGGVAGVCDSVEGFLDLLGAAAFKG